MEEMLPLLLGHDLGYTMQRLGIAELQCLAGL